MTYEERYLFDLTGYLVVKNMMDRQRISEMLDVVDRIEPQIREHVEKPPFVEGFYGVRYHKDRLGYYSYRQVAGSDQIIVDDFFNIDPVFLHFIDHKRTLEYIREMILGQACIRSMELRYRYPGNKTFTHMGSLIDIRNRYVFHGRPVLSVDTGKEEMRYFELTVVRVLYALHDITPNDGPLCVVPGSHKANLPSPFDRHPEKEPYMVGLEMKAGDAIFFSENTRHGGLPISSKLTRKTVHVTYNPVWVMGMSPVHWNGAIPILPETDQHLTDSQRILLRGYPVDGYPIPIKET